MLEFLVRSISCTNGTLGFFQASKKTQWRIWCWHGVNRWTIWCTLQISRLKTLPDQQGKWLLSQRCSMEIVHFLHPQIPVKGLVVKVPGQIQCVLSVPKGTGLLYRSRVYLETMCHKEDRAAVESQSHLQTGSQSVCLAHNCVSR